MAAWESVSLQDIDPGVLSAVQNANTVAQAGQAGLAASIGTIATTMALVPAVINVADAAAKVALQTAAGVVTSVFNTGFYGTLCYPTRVDWSRAVIKERITDIDRLIGTEEVPDLIGNRADKKELREERANLKRKLHFSASDLELNFPFSTWADLVEQSMSDPLDNRRPTFDSTAITCGVVIMVSATRIQDFITAIKALAALLRAKKLDRYSRYMQNAIGTARYSEDARSTPGAFPDWESYTIARLFGVEKDVKDLKAALASAGGLFNTGQIEKMNAFVAAAAANVGAVAAATEAALDVFRAVVNANARASILYIPPVDGETTLNVPGVGPVKIPKATYGNQGFIDVMRAADNAPKEEYVAGIALMTGAFMPGLAGVFGTSPIDLAPILNGTRYLGAPEIAVLKGQIQGAAASLAAVDAFFKKVASA